MDVATGTSMRNDVRMKRWMTLVLICLTLTVVVGFAVTRDSEPGPPFKTIAYDGETISEP